MVLDLGGSNDPKAMQCPHCHVALSMSSRQNIEIDYCPKCRGIWLDRGELDKIIERSMAEQSEPRLQAQPRARRESYDDDYEDRYKGKKRYKKKSWLAEIFDELT